MADFLVYKYNLNDISIKEVNKQFIGNFENYLLSEYSFSKNYLTGLLKKLRHIIQLALDNEWIYKNPFSEYKLQWQKTDRGYLTQSEIETLINARFDDKGMETACDIFLFCCFTGLAYIDVKNLSHENIQSAFNGNLWIRGKRIKCNTDYSIPLMNITKTILEKYKGQTSGNLLLPVKCVQWYNILLERIGKQCGINKKITSHLARHTFATLTLSKGVSIESVSKMLGHTKISTTQIYARITDDKISNDMEAFAGKLSGIETKYSKTS
jgi:site-specific recombinase XerD